MKIILSLTCIVIFFSSCNAAPSATQHADTTRLPPVETNKPNTDFKPAFQSQTRAPGTQTATPWEGIIVTKSLKAPWGIVALPDGRMLVTENRGNMRIVNVANSEVSDPITGIPDVDDRGQGGLLGLTLAPDFAQSRMIYWVFSEKVSGGNHTAVAKGRLADDEKSLEQVQVIYRAIPTYDGTKHYGGRIIFDRDGYLFVSTGERSDKATRAQSQDLQSALGKILRIDTNGKPAAGNPFENVSGARPEIYSYGHRNTQGLAFHPVTGVLWNNEFGPRGGDELNLIKPGANYGWPIITYGIEYSGSEIGNPPIQQQDGMEQPVYYWDPVLSPSGMTFYTGDKMPEWKNNLFITGLNSYHIARIILKDDKVVGEERLLADERQRFRDITQGADGALYAITDSGRMYRLAKK